MYSPSGGGAVMHIVDLLFCLSAWDSTPCVKCRRPAALCAGLYAAECNTIRSAPIRVRRVVVVGVARRVDVPCVVGVGTVRGTQSAVLSLQSTPNRYFLNLSEYLLRSDSRHARIRFRVSIAFPLQ